MVICLRKRKNDILKLIIIILIAILIVKIQFPRKLLQIFFEGKYYDVSFNDIQNNIYLGKNEDIIDFAVGDIDSDGDDEVLTLVKDKGSLYGKELLIYDFSISEKELELKEIYRNNIALINPWKIKTCEIDGDKELEIFIIVNKSTRYYKEVDNRPFFFNFKEGVLIKKWTGSRVRGAFEDVYFEDINGNGRDEFIVIEKGNNGGYVIAVYYWFGFGFILQGESLVYEEVKGLSVKKLDEDILLEARVKKDGRWEPIILEPSIKKNENDIYLLEERGL